MEYINFRKKEGREHGKRSLFSGLVKADKNESDNGGDYGELVSRKRKKEQESEHLRKTGNLQ